MENVGFSIFVIGILPMFTSIILYFMFKGKWLGKLTYWQKQLIAGIVFGILAICGTEFGIPINGAIINARDASPLCAALIFGAPAGIISGVIGGVERWLCVYWGGGYYTRLACSVSTVIAGVAGAFFRKDIFDDELPTFGQAVLFSTVIEVIHMLMIFLTNLDDVRTAFVYVEACTNPMVTTVALAVGVAVLMIRALENGGITYTDDNYQTINEQLQRKLIGVVLVGFVLTFFFNFLLQNRIMTEDTSVILFLNIEDATGDVEAETRRYLYLGSRNITNEVDENTSKAELNRLRIKYDVSEINLIRDDGIVFNSSNSYNVGYDMKSDPDSARFLSRMQDSGSYVQKLRDDLISEGICKYAGFKTDFGFVQMALTLEQYHNLVNDGVKSVADNRHIGESGMIVIIDRNGKIVSDTFGDFFSITDFEEKIHFDQKDEKVVYRAEIVGLDVYYMFATVEGYRVIALYPQSEADFSRRLSVYITSFMEMIVFGLIFVAIFESVKTSVVGKIINVKEALNEITDGDLNTVVNVRGNREFDSLSTDINEMVDKLKQLIAEANERIDSELRYAEEIQAAVLPNTFPPYPDRKEFDIYALMDPARQVGGDFYDFYLLDDDTLVFLVADVSGKGIPASLFMMRAKTILKSQAEKGVSPGRIFENANTQLCEGNDADMFVTAWMGFLNLKTGELRYANAGHNRPLIRRKNKDFEYLQGPAGFILAGMEGIKYQEQKMILKPGDEIFLYTDGVVEATDPQKQLYGDDRLLVCANAHKGENAHDICQSIKEDVDKFYYGAEQFDDITELSLQFIRKMKK